MGVPPLERICSCEMSHAARQESRMWLHGGNGEKRLITNGIAAAT